MFSRYHQIVRCIHQTCNLMKRKASMPGVHRQLGALENASDLVEDPAALDELEADFNYSGKMEIQHREELAAQRDHIRHMMVKHKYFRDEPLPNMLLYAEKEEIRNLHARDPEEWTFERLAESFPATPEIIKKIIKAKWRPHSAKRIRAQDQMVIQNWQRLQNTPKGDQFLPPHLREHFAKFAARTLKQSPPEGFIKSQLPQLPKPKSTEFSSIITSCKKYAHRPTTKSENGNENEEERNFPRKMKVPNPENETYLLDEVKDKRSMRLEDWKKQNIEQFEQLQIGSEHMMNANDDDETSQIDVTPENPSGTSYVEKFQSNEIVINAEDSKRYEISTYKERIHIPRKLYRKGGTYKVEDCYYDDDGEFLYRVPGMSGTQQQQHTTYGKRRSSNE